MYYPKHPKKCPMCQQKAGARIIWGMPSMTVEVEAGINKGTLVLGGCIVSPDDADFRCVECGHEWRKWPKWRKEHMYIGVISEVEYALSTVKKLKFPGVLCNQSPELCTQKWSELIVTDKPEERFCEICNESVLLVRSMRELRRLRKSGLCVAYCGQGSSEGTAS